MTLTDEEIRIKIAEACGWRYDPTAAPDMKYVGIMCWIRPGNSDWQTEQTPDYLSDLNAMHEAEKLLTNKQLHEYREQLAKVLQTHCYDVNLLLSPAAQRAEAFLRTLNLWKP